MLLLRVSVEVQSLECDFVQLERAWLALPVLTPLVLDGLADDEPVSRRLVELAAADALALMRNAVGREDWATVDRMLQDASRQFAGNERVGAMLQAMKSIAESRSH